MPVKLFFGHADNESATAKMAINDAEAVAFDYVELVKHLFDNPDDAVVAEIEESYNYDQQDRLLELVKKIEDTAKGRISKGEVPVSSELEDDIPF